MRILVSYFYHVRHFKPYMIPFSTAVWDPAWYHNFNKCHNYTYLDKNGVLNGLRMPFLKPCSNCKGLCSGKELCKTLFGELIPNECLFLKEYKSQLKDLDFESIKDILEEQDNKCAICGMPPIWNNKELVFIIDHIDGNAANNKRDNLRCICPNCDSQLDTYKSKNKNGARSYYRYHKEDPINKIGK